MLKIATAVCVLIMCIMIYAKSQDEALITAASFVIVLMVCELTKHVNDSD